MGFEVGAIGFTHGLPILRNQRTLLYNKTPLFLRNGAFILEYKNKKITEQSEVDTMAKAINDAIASIEKKPIDKPASPETGDNSNMWLWRG